MAASTLRMRVPNVMGLSKGACSGLRRPQAVHRFKDAARYD